MSQCPNRIGVRDGMEYLDRDPVVYPHLLHQVVEEVLFLCLGAGLGDASNSASTEQSKL